MGARLARALDASPRMLEDHGIESARDLVGALLQLEDEFGLVPNESGNGLAIDPEAEKAPKADAAIKALGRAAPTARRGRDNPGGVRRLEKEVLGVAPRCAPGPQNNDAGNVGNRVGNADVGKGHASDAANPLIK